MATQRDLALAYSPGVAEACMEIARDPAEAMDENKARYAIEMQARALAEVTGT